MSLIPIFRIVRLWEAYQTIHLIHRLCHRVERNQFIPFSQVQALDLGSFFLPSMPMRVLNYTQTKTREDGVSGAKNITGLCLRADPAIPVV
jgi:hypothetical protein